MLLGYSTRTNQNRTLSEITDLMYNNGSINNSSNLGSKWEVVNSKSNKKNENPCDCRPIKLVNQFQPILTQNQNSDQNNDNNNDNNDCSNINNTINELNINKCSRKPSTVINIYTQKEMCLLLITLKLVNKMFLKQFLETDHFLMQLNMEKRFVLFVTVTLISSINPNETGGGAKQPPPWHILLYNFLVTHPNFMKFGDFS